MVEDDGRLEPVDCPVFTRQRTALGLEWITVSHWPRHINVTCELVMEGDHQYIRPDEGGIEFVAANGWARYRWIGMTEHGDFDGVLQHCHLNPATVATR